MYPGLRTQSDRPIERAEDRTTRAQPFPRLPALFSGGNRYLDEPRSATRLGSPSNLSPGMKGDSHEICPASRLALSGQGLLDAEFLPGLQVKGVPFDFPDDILLHNLPLEAAERALNHLAVLEPYFSCHLRPATMFPRASYGFFRHRNRLDLRQFFRQFLAGLKARIPFCGDGDGFPRARVAA